MRSPLVPCAFLTVMALASLSACAVNEAVNPLPGAGGNGGSGGAGGAIPGPPAWDRAVTPPKDAEAASKRLACAYKAGSLPAETQGEAHPNGKAIPIDHILIVMQENRSFDHYFQKLPAYGQPDVEVAPAGFTNPDSLGVSVAPFHNPGYCFVDTNHEWSGSHQQYGGGKMDGFVISNDGSGTPPPHPLSDSMSGVRAMGYYDEGDLPFYYWLASEFAIADHYHCSLLGPTWPNRMYIYAASSRGAIDNTLVEFNDRKAPCKKDVDCGGAAGSCVSGACKGACQQDADCGLDAPLGSCDVAAGGVCAPVGRTIFDYLEQRHIAWKVYASGTPGFATVLSSWLKYHADHQVGIEEYYADAKAGTLPAVAFIDSHIGAESYDQDDEHPPATPQGGQRFVAQVIDALTKSPNWPSSALFLTYDEHGGLFDHVVPPPACPPGDFPANVPEDGWPGDFDRLGIRVPMMAISPFAKKHFVAHHVYDHTSLLRLIEARFILPAITDRDANAEAPWEMFDFTTPPHATPPTITLPPIDEAKLADCAKVWAP